MQMAPLSALLTLRRIFKYLCSIIDSSLTFAAEVDKRIKVATTAFDALEYILTNLFVALRVNVSALVLSIFLYGSEA
jgi:hypothetical protein